MKILFDLSKIMLPSKYHFYLMFVNYYRCIMINIMCYIYE